MKISESIVYIGVDDHQIDLFEGQFLVPNGMAYNSYLISDEKTAVMDSVDARFAAEWLQKLETALNGKTPDYLVVQHMEPDHSGSIAAFVQRYPQAKLVASAKAFGLMDQFFEPALAAERIPVSEGGTLSLGTHTLTFYTAPMVHWPEVIMTYESTEGVLFSADAFGKFGALDTQEDWACEARRYYFGIVGKYGQPVQTVLKKLAGLKVRQICPLHGPVLSGNIGEYTALYQTWSAYQAETKGVAIFYASAHGHTRAAAEALAEMLERRGERVAITDLARGDMAEAVEDAFRFDRMVLASVTYNAGVFPVMRDFVQRLTDRGYQNRTVGIVENGSWAPMAAKTLRQMLENSKNVAFAEPVVTIRSAMKEADRAQLEALCEALCQA